jgi:uncharacterized protein
MNAERALYLDSSAIVKLAIAEPESPALRKYLRRRRPLVSSALALTEVARALLPLGNTAVRRGLDMLDGLELVRISERILQDAGAMPPAELRSPDAIHLATMRHLGASVSRVVTYDLRMMAAVTAFGLAVSAPS